MSRRFYWLKLQRDFFKRHDIMVLESMPDGKEYVLLYMKLLAESIDHEGALRFSDTIPYNESMLATITHTAIEIVHSALAVFKDLKLMEVLPDDTLYIPAMESMIGSETDAAKWKRDQRKRDMQKANPDNVRVASGKCQTELESEIDKEKDKTSVSPGANSYTPEFLQFWEIYPRKVEKKGAFGKWKVTLRKGYEATDLIAAATAYSEHCVTKETEDRYIKHPSTFLGPNEGWKEWCFEEDTNADRG